MIQARSLSDLSRQYGHCKINVMSCINNLYESSNYNIDAKSPFFVHNLLSIDSDSLERMQFFES
jgi:hypothetical protein